MLQMHTEIMGEMSLRKLAYNCCALQFQDRFDFQGVFKKALHIHVLFKPVRILMKMVHTKYGSRGIPRLSTHHLIGAHEIFKNDKRKDKMYLMIRHKYFQLTLSMKYKATALCLILISFDFQSST